MSHGYIFASILFGVLSQVIVKWQMNMVGALPEEVPEKVIFMLRLLINPWIILSVFLTFLAGLSWMAAMTKFPISYAYPFMSLSFALILILGAIFFHETLTLSKGIGMGFIMAGIIIASRQ